MLGAARAPDPTGEPPESTSGAQNGKAALIYDTALEATVQGHCEHMSTHGFFDFKRVGLCRSGSTWGQIFGS